MATSPSQRAYRAPCPGCGAPVEFRSAQSTHAVCGYCQSTVVRQGEVLSRLGKMAELFDDHSLLQLGASGRWQSQAFTLVGRLQYRYAQGTWTEWQALLDDGRTATLSEDNGAYVFSETLQTQRAMPPAENFKLGATTAINGKPYVVASNTPVSLIAAQGELPKLPELGQEFVVVELRSDSGEVVSVDYRLQPPEVSRGRAATLQELAMTGLKDESAKNEQGRQFDCPQCGAPVAVQLGGSKSITCGSCHALIDLSSGVGGELAHAMQDEPVQPLIPLGKTGTLQGASWQVVGFQHRMGHELDDPDEHFGWDEYLLYNAERGFAFLVDSSEGWSLVKPLTGAPTLSADGNTANYMGTRYTHKYSYNAETTYVEGEFYWQVQRGQTTYNRDFAKAKSLLSMEQTPREITWSSGSQIASDTVAQAFGLNDRKDALQRNDASPVSSSKGSGCLTIIVVLVILLVLVLLLSRCSRCDPRVENCSASSSGSSSRSSGGSFGGFSSGGGHK